MKRPKSTKEETEMGHLEHQDSSNLGQGGSGHGGPYTLPKRDGYTGFRNWGKSGMKVDNESEEEKRLVKDVYIERR